METPARTFFEGGALIMLLYVRICSVGFGALYTILVAAAIASSCLLPLPPTKGGALEDISCGRIASTIALPPGY